MTSSLDRRSTVRNSGWHWGDGVQHETIHDLAALQEELTANSGISGLEVVDPAEPGFASRAAKLFHRDGFVCIKDALTPEHLAALRVRCEDAMHAIVGADQFGGAKGAWRYMFGGSSITNSCMHFPEYAQLSALPTVDPVLTEIWGTPDYICYGGGGDFCLPGSEYQPLHSDSGDASKQELDSDGNITDILPLDAPERPGYAYNRGGGFYDPTGRLSHRDLPCSQLIVDFNTTAWGPLDGAIRFVPGTQNSKLPIPSLAEEPQWMKMSTVCPIPAGCAILRDIRCWHGGTPCIGDTPRAMPSCNFHAPWFQTGAAPHIMPREVYEELSPRGQSLCRYIATDPEESLTLGWKQGGSRVTNHRLSLEQLQSIRAGPQGGSMTGFWPWKDAAAKM